MSKVAVIGLGIMGHGIADNFLKHGYDVTVWNRTPEKAANLVVKGAVLAATAKGAVEQADIVFEVTANDESSRGMWLGDDGIVASANPDQYLITCATTSVAWTDELAQKCAEKGLKFVDMPMTGGRVGAENGELILLAGSTEAALEDIVVELQAIAREVKYFDKTGAGMRFKLLLNALQAIHIAGFGEMLHMAKAAGLDEKLVGDALAERPGGVPTTLAWRDYQKEPDPINFSVEWIAKDLGYAAEMSGDTPHPLLDDALARYQQAIQAGYSQADWTKINKL